ncbi:hypothetical protein PFISCL1PPCAC_4208, partial [Pristionchus fissidentatus]
SPPSRTPNATTPRTATLDTAETGWRGGHFGYDPLTAVSPPTAGTPIAHSIRMFKLYRDENSDPIRQQERVSYENMLLRYGDWSRIRGQFMVYTVLLVIALLYRGHSEQFEFLRELKTVTGRHIQCCCDVPQRLKDIKDL